MSDYFGNPFGGSQFESGFNDPFGSNKKRRIPGSRQVNPETYRLAQAAKEREERRRELLKPVEWIFDRLSTGQYLSANIVDQIINASQGQDTDIMGAIKGSFTGEARKSFSDVLREHGLFGIEGEDLDDPWFDKRAEEGRFLGNIDTAGVLGFILDVVADPINYVTFGSTKVAQKAAQNYADTVLKATFKNPDNLATFAERMRGSVDVDDIMELGRNNPKKFQEWLTNVANNSNDGAVRNFALEMNNMWRNAYHEGLRLGEDEMRGALKGLYAEVQDTKQRNMVREAVQGYKNILMNVHQNLARKPTDWQAYQAVHAVNPKFAERFRKLYKEGTADGGPVPSWVSESAYENSPHMLWKQEMDRLNSPEFFQEMMGELDSVLHGTKRFEDLPGEFRESVSRVFKDAFSDEGEFLERFKSVADNPAFDKRVADATAGAGVVGFNVFNKALGKHLRQNNLVAKSYDVFVDKLRGKYNGSRLQDAIYARLEGDTMVGNLRKWFGVKNPYQKFIHRSVKDESAAFSVGLEDLETRVTNIMDNFDSDEMKSDYFMLRAEAQELQKPINAAADKYAREKLGYGVFDDGNYVDIDYQQTARISPKDWQMYQIEVRSYLKKNGVDPISVARSKGYDEAYIAKLEKAHKGVDQFLDDLNKTEYSMMQEGFVVQRESLENYLPLVYRKPTFKTKGPRGNSYRAGGAPSLHQEKGPFKAAETEANMLQVLYGIDEKLAKELVESKKATGIINDLEEVLLRRGVHTEMLKARANTLRSLREFGFNTYDIRNVSPEMHKFLSDEQNSKQLGLQKVTGNMAGAFSKKGAKGYNYLFDADVSKVIARVSDISKNPSWFKEHLGPYTRWWRSVVTSNPGFHLRNFFSNNVMLYTEFGVKAFNPKYLNDARLAATVGLNKKKRLKMLGDQENSAKLSLQRRYGGYTLNELIDYARRKGIISEASMINTVDDPVEAMMRRRAGRGGPENFREFNEQYSPLSSNNKFFQLSRDFGGEIESMSRFQAFIMEIDELTGNGKFGLRSRNILEHASNRARRLLLDYNDLTDVERNVFKQIIPFYTWIRKNIANQMNIISQPRYWGRIANIPKLQELFADDEDFDYNNMPEYMRESGYFPIGRAEEGERMMFWPNIPIMDLNKIPIAFEPGRLARPSMSALDIKNEIFDMSHPALKTVVELSTGYDLFKERPIQPTEEADRSYALITRIPGVAQVLDTVLRAGQEDIGLVKSVDENGVAQMNGRVVKVLDNMFPLAKALNRYIDGVEEVPELLFNTNALEELVDRVAGASDPETATEEALRTMSYFTGIKANSFDEEEGRFWRARDIMDKVETQRKILREQETGRAARSEQWRNRFANQYRRLGIY